MEFLDQVPDGVLAIVVTSALGGIVGGLIVGIRADLSVSGLIGVITGLSLAVPLKMLNVEPFWGVEGYSLVYSFLAGVASAWVVARSSV